MTKHFNKYVHCPQCGCSHTHESGFERWVRANSKLDSAFGHVISDFDYFIHRYKTPTVGREVQCVMFLEVKTFGAQVSGSQSSSLSMAKTLMKSIGIGAGSTYDIADGPGGPIRRVRNYGGFLLRLSHSSPTDSEWMEWHGKPIDVATLEEVLAFDRDPHTFKKMDWRWNHHYSQKTPVFPLWQLQGMLQ